MKHFIIIFCFLISCSFNFAQHNSKEDIRDLVYFEPVFVHRLQTKPPIVYERFENIAEYSLDSIFDAKQKKYRIKTKLVGALTDFKTNKLIEVFKSLKNEQSNVSNIPILNEITKDLNKRFCIFFLFETRSDGKSFKSQLSNIKLQTIVYDRIKKGIVFHKESKSLAPIHNGGYTNTIIKNLNYIYKALKKL